MGGTSSSARTRAAPGRASRTSAGSFGSTPTGGGRRLRDARRAVGGPLHHGEDLLDGGVAHLVRVGGEQPQRHGHRVGLLEGDEVVAARLRRVWLKRQVAVEMRAEVALVGDGGAERRGGFIVSFEAHHPPREYPTSPTTRARARRRRFVSPTSAASRRATSRSAGRAGRRCTPVVVGGAVELRHDDDGRGDAAVADSLVEARVEVVELVVGLGAARQPAHRDDDGVTRCVRGRVAEQVTPTRVERLLVVDRHRRARAW